MKRIRLRAIANRKQDTSALLLRAMRTVLRPRFIWGAVDQGVFSLTSFALSIGVAHRATAAEFGAFGVAYVVYTLVLGTVQAFTAEVLVVRSSHLSSQLRRSMLSMAAGTSAICGFVCTLVGLLFLLLLHGPAATAVPPLFVLAPALFVQNVWRFGFFAAGRARSAALNDCVWAAILAVGFAVVPVHGPNSWTNLIWCWSVAGAACGILGAAQSHCLPRPDLVVRWIREQKNAGGRFAGEYLALYGAGQGVLFWVTLFGGLAQSGGYRGAQLLFGPIQVLVNTVRLAVTPAVSRAYQAGRRRAAWRGAIAVTCCAVALAFVWGIVLLLLPPAAGHHLLRKSWGPTRPLILPTLFITVAGGFSVGAVIFLRVVGAYRQTFRIRLGGAAAIFLLGGLGAIKGAVWAATGAGVAESVTVGMLWIQAAQIARVNRSTREAAELGRAPI